MTDEQAGDRRGVFYYRSVGNPIDYLTYISTKALNELRARIADLEAENAKLLKVLEEAEEVCEWDCDFLYSLKQAVEEALR